MSWQCLECDAANNDDNVKCICGRYLAPSNIGKSQNVQGSYVEKNERDAVKYPVLKLISGGYKVLAWLVIPYVPVMILAAIKASPTGEISMTTIIFDIFYGVLAFITLYAISEIIQLFIDIEYDLRKCNEHPSETQ